MTGLFLPEIKGSTDPKLIVEAEAMIPMRRGTFKTIVFRHSDAPAQENLAIVSGDVTGHDVLVRMHSECITSEVFGSLKCDCADQLDHALERIGTRGRGVVLYLRQEGRGIGLANKIRAYALQSRGVDTVDANRMLGLPDDSRRYDSAAAMLTHLGVQSVRLLTNNPDKVAALAGLGIEVRSREPVLVRGNAHSAMYLATKRDRMNHQLPMSDGRAVHSDAE